MGANSIKLYVIAVSLYRFHQVCISKNNLAIIVLLSQRLAKFENSVLIYLLYICFAFLRPDMKCSRFSLVIDQFSVFELEFQ